MHGRITMWVGSVSKDSLRTIIVLFLLVLLMIVLLLTMMKLNADEDDVSNC